MQKGTDHYDAPGPELRGKILRKIDAIEYRRLLVKASAFGIMLLGSIGFVVYACFAVFADASRSGFTAFASLFFTDFRTTFGSFSDFAMSLAESFPTFSFTMLISGIFFTIWSGAEFLNEITFFSH